MVTTPPDPVDELVDQLVDRHDIRPADALSLLRRAAARKGVDLAELATRVIGSTATRVV